METFTVTSWSMDGKQKQALDPQRLEWGGSWRDCARHLSLSVQTDSLCPLGGSVELRSGDRQLFLGTVCERSMNTSGHLIDLQCYDRGIYLKRNRTYRMVRRQTPEGETARLCQEYQIPVGSLAPTGVKMDRNFLGVTLFQVIQTMYSLAAEKNGKKYQIRFEGGKLNVVEKAIGANSLRLVRGTNLLDCTSTESIMDLVNSVAVYDKNAKRTATYKGGADVAKYGLMEEAIQAEKREDPAAQARDILQENGVQTTLNAPCIGNSKLITGTAVSVYEPKANVDGMFWIQKDRHRVERGVYTTDLELEFRNLMDKQQAGRLPTE